MSEAQHVFYPCSTSQFRLATFPNAEQPHVAHMWPTRGQWLPRWTAQTATTIYFAVHLLVEIEIASSFCSYKQCCDEHSYAYRITPASDYF